jgi:dihydrofolate reductase
VAHSLGDALARCRAANETAAFVIGGAALYREALPLADELRLTEVHAAPAGDTRFPDYDRAAWREANREDHDGFAFVDYERQPRGATA